MIDLGLLLVFAVQHTVMARDPFKQWLTRVVPRTAERSTYVLAASLAMGLMFWQWQALPASVWDLHTQPWVLLVWVVYGVGWVVAIAATYMIDHWEFLGLRQGGWLPARPSTSDSVSRRWLYAWVRHPMMLGLLVAFWATPSMTVGHLLFAIGGTSYIAVGVRFEERDLRRHLGPAYDDYARSVPQLLPDIHRASPGVDRRATCGQDRAGPDSRDRKETDAPHHHAPPLHVALPRSPRFSPPFSLQSQARRPSARRPRPPRPSGCTSRSTSRPCGPTRGRHGRSTGRP